MIAFSAATVSDIPAIVPLVESAYRGDASRKGWTTEADLLDGQRIDSEGVREIILKADSKVVGVANKVVEEAGDSVKNKLPIISTDKLFYKY